jgi:hypothetical protein
VIFLGGYTNPPVAWQAHGKKLAEFGFHAILPAYNNRWSGCTGTDCNANTRWEALTGEDVSTAIVASRADSAEGRVVTILKHLTTAHPGGDWGYYLDGTGNLLYDRIIIAGISHGAASTGLYASRRAFSRAVMHSGGWGAPGKEPADAPQRLVRLRPHRRRRLRCHRPGLEGRSHVGQSHEHRRPGASVRRRSPAHHVGAQRLSPRLHRRPLVVPQEKRRLRLRSRVARPVRRGRTVALNEQASPASASDETELHELQERSFRFFAERVNPTNGLVADSTQPGGPSSIAGVGFALSSYPVGVERGFMARAVALSHSLAAARFFDQADQSGAVDGVGHRGFFYHFLDMNTGGRAWKSELSTIDTALLLTGLLVAAEYFDGTAAEERELRERVAAIYARIDWVWAQNGGDAIALAWTPEKGFFRHRWVGYNEALVLYVLALAAPEHRVSQKAYAAWTSTFRWKRIYGRDVLYAGPLFIHQFSHIWVDLRGIRDAFMVSKDSDYFENSRRITQIHQEYAIRNSRRFAGYDASSWGFTASDGPGEETLTVQGKKRRFYGYRARGAPFGPDDGTVSPWAAVASLPFAPEIVIPSIRRFNKLLAQEPSRFGFNASFNPSYRDRDARAGWVSPWHYALNEGPMVLMIENYRTGLVWRLMRECAAIRSGLERAAFRGGWLVD